MKQPVWWQERWMPAGPGYCRCPKCGAICSTNAFARAKHACPPTPKSTKGAAMKTKHDKAMTKFYRAHDPQAAAEYIAALSGIDRDNAMLAAEHAGFLPEFYANSIRVHLQPQ